MRVTGRFWRRGPVGLAAVSLFGLACAFDLAPADWARGSGAELHLGQAQAQMEQPRPSPAAAGQETRPAETTQGPIQTRRFFSENSPWNKAIGKAPALAATSGAIVAQLQQFAGFQLNQNRWTVNVSMPPDGTPRQLVTDKGLADHAAEGFSYWGTADVPVAPDAVGTPDDDAHLVIVDEAHNRVFNFYGTQRSGTGQLKAIGMGVFRLDGSGWWDPDGGTSPGPWTGRSSNASLLGGLIFPEELKAGAIPHALALGLDPEVGQSMDKDVSAPAKTFDVHPTGRVPGGTRLQLDPDLDLNSLRLGREAMVICRALQTYGAFIVESSSGLALYFRSNHNRGMDQYAGMDFTGIRRGDPAFAVIRSKLRVVAPAPPEGGYDYPSVWSPPNPRRY